MDHYQATAVFHVFDERLLRRFRPRVAVVVHDDCGVIREAWLETGHVLTLRGRGNGRDVEQAGLVQSTFDDSTAQFPIMVAAALPGEEHHFDRWHIGRSCERGERRDRQREHETSEKEIE